MRLTSVLSSSFLLVLLASACDKPVVEWSDPVRIDAPSDAHALRLVFDASGAPRLAADSVIGATAPGDSSVCKASLRTAWAATRLYAAWWSVRRDSSASLDAAWSTDSGRTWTPAVTVDSADTESAGCDRPAPAVATVHDDLYLAYSMNASEGTGVFFAHYMDGMVHAPVAVIYGDHLVPVAIAVDGDRVVVVYDDPNGTRQQVGIALSVTQGHIFEWRGTASRSIDGATTPLVALRDSLLDVAWITRRENESPTHVVRRGLLR